MVAAGLVDYDCTFIGKASESGTEFTLGVRVPVTSLCPCSKAISDYGAHNQRGHISVMIQAIRSQEGESPLIWIEEIVDVAERSASAPVYALIKRPDERHVTMQAFDNPVFVEDMVRGVAVTLQQDSRVAWFSVRATNLESIHNHNAFAATSWRRP
jgi:GTP cyclohydrolase I